VAILSMNSDRYVEYLFAVPGRTRWSIRQHPLEPREIAYSLLDSDTSVLFVDDVFAPMLPALREQVPGLSTVVHCGTARSPKARWTTSA